MISEQETKMPITEFLEKKSVEVNTELEKIYPHSIDNQKMSRVFGKPRYAYSSETTQLALNKPMWDLLDRGGKRWRPILAMLICEALGGNVEKHKTILSAWEIVHNGSLIVDDIEDDSQNRRDKLCVHRIFGVDVAVNAGNFMYYLPLTLLINNGNDLTKSQVIEIYNIYSQEMINISLGQGMDIIWHNHKAREPTEAEYLQMTAYKTGTLARMSAKIAAIIASANNETVEIVGEYAETIGVAFQIQDDLLELTEKKFQEVKGSLCGDIHEGKRTLAVIKTIEKANEKDRKRLVEILDSHTLDNNEIQEALDIINNYGGIVYAKKRAQEIMNKSWEKLDKRLPESNAKKVLYNFTNFLVNRKI